MRTKGNVCPQILRQLLRESLDKGHAVDIHKIGSQCRAKGQPRTMRTGDSAEEKGNRGGLLYHQ